MSKRAELIGERFTRLEVIEFVEINKHGASVWLCQCDCGNITRVTAIELNRGSTVSCGCYHKEIARELMQSRRYEYGIASRNSLYNNYKQAARKRNYSFDLTMDQCEVFWKQNCYYCGIKPIGVINSDNSGAYIYNGIDRVDNDLGYAIDNCVTCCKFCNFAKRNMTDDEFIIWVFRIAQHLSDKYTKDIYGESSILSQ